MFFKNMLFRRKRFYLRWKDAFPRAYGDDVRYICSRLSFRSASPFGLFFSAEDSAWTLRSGETVRIPYRIYLEDVFEAYDTLTPRQRIVYHCIFSRSYDGHVREKHVLALLECEESDALMPYVVKLCDEYVAEILQTVYHRLHLRDCTAYREFCSVNLDRVKLGHSRMISYWNEFYRIDCYRYRDYIGRRLYGECFGYGKTGQKQVHVT